MKGATRSLKFTSKAAFTAALTAKKLPLQVCKLLGMDDFVETYQTDNLDAFTSEDDDKILDDTMSKLNEG